MMEDLEKTKPVAEPAMDDDETGAGCDVCMSPIALVGALNAMLARLVD